MFPGVTNASAFARVMEQLIEGDFQTRWDAAKRLATWGNEAIAPLIPLLEDEDLDWEIRWFVARILGRLDDSRALDALVKLLQQTGEPELTAIAAEGLSQFGDRGVAALASLLDDPQQALTAVHALASIRHSTAFIPLMRAAESLDSTVRTAAFAALANFRNPKVDTLLMDALKDPSASVRQEVITHLGFRPYLLNTVDVVALVAPALKELSVEVGRAAAITLGRLGTEAAIAHLAEVLAAPLTPKELQVYIVRALGWTENTTALSVLLSAYPDAVTSVKIEIIEALAQLQTASLRQKAGEALCYWLRDESTLSEDSPQIQQAIAIALGNLQHQAAKPLLQDLAQAADEQTRLYAESALRKLTP